MKLLYIIEISLRNLLSRKTRSVLTVSGVAIGVGAITFLVSVGFGLEKMTTSQIASTESLNVFDASLEDSDLISISDGSLLEIMAINGVEKVEPGISIAGKAGQNQIKTDVVAYGLNTQYLDMAEMKLYSGERYQDTDGDKAIVSTALLKLLQIENNSFQGKEIFLDIIIDSNLSPELENSSTKKIDKLKIVGLLDDESSPLVMIPLELMKKETQAVNYNTVKVRVADKGTIGSIILKVQSLGFYTDYIGETIEQINNIFNIFRYVIASFGFVAMMVAILGMFNTLTVSLLERTREIGVLKANGALKKDIWRLFISEAMIISTIGGFFGIALGVVNGEIVNFIFNLYAQKNSAQAIDFFYTPFIFIALSGAFIMIVGFFVGFYPARRASNIKILDALKYE